MAPANGCLNLRGFIDLPGKSGVGHEEFSAAVEQTLPGRAAPGARLALMRQGEVTAPWRRSPQPPPGAAALRFDLLGQNPLQIRRFDKALDVLTVPPNVTPGPHPALLPGADPPGPERPGSDCRLNDHPRSTGPAFCWTRPATRNVDLSACSVNSG